MSAETVGREATQRSVRALRHAAQDAKEAEVRFRLVAENSADVLFQTDVEGLCTWVSPSVRLVLGWEVEDLLGGNPLDLVHPDDARLVRFHLPILSDSTPNSLEIRFATVGEGYRWMSAISRELHGRSGELVGCLYALRDVEEQVQRREQLAYRASHDALTGLVDRTEAMEALAEALERAKLKHTWVGLLYVDIDHFKAVNDTYGHLEGDRLLIRVAQLLKDTLRETDVVARIGGDEFIAVLPSMREPDIAVVRAEALLATVSQPGDPDFPQASLSIGVAVGDGSHDADQLLAMADAALYRAKTGGRNRLSQS
ncbi:MAG: diguanylate cyclase [Actinobacteria bacterium]|nr:diguanylate cyclase [Actinomycetota bacterium]